MIASEKVSRVVRRGTLGPLARGRARRRGRLDAAGGIPRSPLTVRVGTEPVPDLVLTPYVREVWDTARQSTQQMRSALILQRRDLVARVRAESVRVVTQYDVRHAPAPAALARYGHWVAEWRTDVDLCRARAQAVVDHCNQQLACYWDALRSGWDTRRALIAAGAAEAPQQQAARPLPDRVELDTSWYEPAVWLLDDDPGHGTATSRALQILQQRADGPDQERPRR
jgi:hypothetical protein